MQRTPESSVRPFPINVPQRALGDLARRLADTRWPDDQTVADDSQGVRTEKMRRLCSYWRADYDWRRCETELNELGSFMTPIDGVEIHFLHVHSAEADALPLVLTHGWPGSIVEFLDVVQRLTDPKRFGGHSNDAFHVVIPSLPGFGFSGKPTESGWSYYRMADAWAKLMQILGYERYVAQGGDWGSIVSAELGRRHPEHCLAAHVNFMAVAPSKEIREEPSVDEKRALASLLEHRQQGMGYRIQQSTRPQTLAYGLTDSPIGQAAWIAEKFAEWTDGEGALDYAVSLDRLLDNITLYWLTASAASSARIYWESARAPLPEPFATPVGYTQYPGELSKPSQRWAEAQYQNIFYWNEAPRGGHFAALEQPEIFAADLQTCFRGIR